ncbi:A kinase (PRKA) anchor protein 7 isoform X2 [Amia ocellicauda]|uniref:A kinase (PRKA) anchor protein 7 isoform X2 n=1 Tax=Amia ocellicauda TaxID=2972642 RepID=UPI0034640D11
MYTRRLGHYFCGNYLTHRESTFAIFRNARLKGAKGQHNLRVLHKLFCSTFILFQKKETYVINAPFYWGASAAFTTSKTEKQVSLPECKALLLTLPPGQVPGRTRTRTRTRTGSARWPDAAGCVTGMDHETDPLETAMPGVEVLIHINPEDDVLYADSHVTGRLEAGNQEKNKIAETENVQKKRKKKNPKIKARKQKVKASDYSNSLLAELPFANTEIRKEFGISTSEKSLKKKRKRKIAAGIEEDADEKKKKKKDHRPNYFVSIPITNPEIKGGIEAVQDIIVQKDHRFSKAMIPVGSLHITLLVTHLGNEEEVNMAGCAVTELKELLPDLLQGKELVLPFSGIAHFRNEVAFVQLAEGEHVKTLQNVAEAVRKAFEEKGILTGDSKAFKPHLTFMKLSRAPKLRNQGIKKLDPTLYENFEHHMFGEETLSRLDLCSMLKKKTPDGYFHCEASITLGEKRVAEPDDDELVSLSKRLVENAVLKAVQQYLEETQQNKNRQAEISPPKTEEKLNTNDSKK